MNESAKFQDVTFLNNFIFNDGVLVVKWLKRWTAKS